MIDWSLWLFDGLLAVLLLLLANRALSARSLFAGVVFFISFGLVLAIAWARLRAPDLALAEAAIGAGLTGALLFSALGEAPAETSSRHLWRRRLPALLLVLLAAPLLLQALWSMPASPSRLTEAVRQWLPASGVTHPVTAVLLNFRAWDTLLELLVLLLALTGLRQLAPSHEVEPRPWPLLMAWGRVLAPLTVLVGGYLLWRGSSHPGGAFQAGALIAAGAVVLRLNRMLPPLRWRHWWVRGLVLLGLLVFVLVGGLTAWWGSGWLTYPEASSGWLIVLIEAAASVSIATILTLLVVGEREEVET